MTEEDQAADAVAAFDPDVRPLLARAAAAIREEAAAAPELDGVSASLKWGQPSYAPRPRKGHAKIGTPIRLGVTKGGEAALFVHCGTSLIADWAATIGADARVEGRRALLLDPDDMSSARLFIRRALTYRKR